ncbi:MAG: vanadium-dependent haloperoxidase [Chlamydiota bacterium]|nr:vanadium-dependent haloperoxidase [Chlamydiota bacterium]
MKHYIVALAMGVCLLNPYQSEAISDKAFFKLIRSQRQVDSHAVKTAVARFDQKTKLPNQTQNGDEALYADKRGSFGKSLLHKSNGFIDTVAFNQLVFALLSGKPSDFDKILMGSTVRKLVNPQASLAFSLSGNDSWINAIPPAPKFSSAQAAGEMVELYWTALARDVPFNEYDANAIVGSAVAELNTLSDFRGPKVGGVVTRGTFLRGLTPGDLVGPYISQFLYQTVPYGPATVAPEISVPTQGTTNDFMTTFTDWFEVVSGGSTGKSTTVDPVARFLRTARDLAAWVHRDYPGQGAVNALLQLLSYGNDALDPNNPYLNNPTQQGFVTFGTDQFFDVLAKAVNEGLKGAWYHKWQVNRRLRPEEYGFYVQKQIADGESLGISSELTSSTAVSNIFSTYGSYFLPQAYPEGSPTHPSYPAGHAVAIGAAVTVLKAFFNEDFVIPNPLQPDVTNTSLEAYTGGDLTVGGELNKLASNICLGRDHAGVHYRCDGSDGMLLGEQIAIDVLNNEGFLYNEAFNGFTLTKFDGTTVTVGKSR